MFHWKQNYRFFEYLGIYPALKISSFCCMRQDMTCSRRWAKILHSMSGNYWSLVTLDRTYNFCEQKIDFSKVDNGFWVKTSNDKRKYFANSKILQGFIKQKQFFEISKKLRNVEEFIGMFEFPRCVSRFWREFSEEEKVVNEFDIFEYFKNVNNKCK